ncbi:unnamed protein product [Moneuplotes crassus]|uniref:3-hydroxyisobutyryl-CoA hydrolase n=2 Tax=Euplotes crassus TaxID=5936 RepID=A0AAD1XGI1_EUPCR|nr:unnamed protein product [Moneuplotes crassus]
MFSRSAIHSKILHLRKLAKASTGVRAMSTAASEPKVLTEYLNKNVFEFTLNNPKTLNSLDSDMIEILWQQIRKWENNQEETPRVVFMKGAGGKAFCAGGDIVSIYKGGQEEPRSKVCAEFFYKEYIVDYALTQMDPIQISIWNGIVMGGGVGVSCHSPIRIATEKSVYAMPETAIGFFTDVGGSYFLARLKDNISNGLFLGLTGHRLKAKDLLKWGVATNYIETSNLPSLYEDVLKHTNKDSKFEEIKEIVDSHSDTTLEGEEIPEETINYCFKPSSVHNIINRLTEVSEGKVDGLDSGLASKWLKTIRRYSPISCGVVTEQILRGKSMTLDDVFKMEYKISQRFMEHGEFFEGVRALLIDKDQSPKWRHSAIEEVTQEEIDTFFNRDEELDLDLPNLYKNDIHM